MRALLPIGPTLRARGGSRLADLLVFSAVLALFYGIVSIAHVWLGPFTPSVEISRAPQALPLYVAYSLLRLSAAYVLSLVFALAYGYFAAFNPRAERFMIPALDTLQSIPVLSFLPPVMLAMVGLFPRSQFGVELGSILLIFTGQVWNMAFSFYSSLKTIPRELKEAAGVCRLSAWQRLTQLELPYAAIGLVWNSMMSVAGGWFFLMACEMFVLGHRDFRLPGLGSYLQTAAAAGDTKAILWGLGAMVSVIVFLDLLVWRPVIAWAERFKFEQVEGAESPKSVVLTALRQSASISYLRRFVAKPFEEYLTLFFAKRALCDEKSKPPRRWMRWLGAASAALAVAFVSTAAARAVLLMLGLGGVALLNIVHSAAVTFLRVNAALLIAAAWAVPTGVAIGLHPRLARLAQPLVQIAASVPATALFPIVLLILVRAGRGMGLASLLLMLLGTQWYILFNVIAGAMAIPADLKEVAGVFRFPDRHRWFVLILPAIFPYLLTGVVTAAGGAWNASVVAEYFHFKHDLFTTTGLGATISRATDEANFPLLIGATFVMAVTVVTVNRLLWRRLFRLAETRFNLQA